MANWDHEEPPGKIDVYISRRRICPRNDYRYYTVIIEKAFCGEPSQERNDYNTILTANKREKLLPNLIEVFL
jgi:hypothetical protein